MNKKREHTEYPITEYENKIRRNHETSKRNNETNLNRKNTKTYEQQINKKQTNKKN